MYVTMRNVKADQRKMSTGQTICWNGLACSDGTGRRRSCRDTRRAAITSRHGITNCTPTPGYEPVMEARMSTLSVMSAIVRGTASTSTGTTIATSRSCLLPCSSTDGGEGGSESSRRRLHGDQFADLSFCRYGASEPHAIAALMGGIAAQEAIKLITRQYVPLDNTFIFDGHTQTASTFRL